MIIRFTLFCALFICPILSKRHKVDQKDTRLFFSPLGKFFKMFKMTFQTFEHLSFKAAKVFINILCRIQSNIIIPLVHEPDITEMNFLYTNRKLSIKVPLTKPNNLWNNRYFRRNDELVILVSGWRSTVNRSTLYDVMSEAFKKRPNVNFVYVDAAHYVNTLYTWAALNTDLIGKHIAYGLRNLVEINKFSHIHLIGHSLGAHVVGSAGRTFHKLTGRRVSRITGLDPAIPCFHNNLPRLGIEDAEIVDIIHTNNDFLGIRDAIGDVDFYPAGGKTFMPGCLGFICSHFRAIEYFAESVNPRYEDSFPVRICSSTQDLHHRHCEKTRHVMGYEMDLSIPGGIYDVIVNKESLFGEEQIMRHGRRLHKKTVRGFKKHNKK